MDSLILFFLILTGVAWTVAGASMILCPDAMRVACRWFIDERRIKPASWVALGFGLLITSGALIIEGEFWIPLIIGLLATAKGLYGLLGDRDQIVELTKVWSDDASDDHFKVMGLLVFALGLVLITHAID